MTTWGITMVRDEADVIEGFVRHSLGEVDGLLVVDNRSTDATPEILKGLKAEYRGRLVVGHDDEVGYYQSRKMSALGELAHAKYGAEWVVPMDADELWIATHRLADVLAGLHSKRLVARAALYHHFRTACDAEGDNPFQEMVYRQEIPAVLPKVAVRWREGTIIEAGNHGAITVGRQNALMGRHEAHLASGPQPAEEAWVEVRHFPYRSAEQMIRKARNGAEAYAATDLPPQIGQHWREYGIILERGGEAALEGVFDEHFFYTLPSEQGLVIDPAPYRRWGQ